MGFLGLPLGQGGFIVLWGVWSQWGFPTHKSIISGFPVHSLEHNPFPGKERSSRWEGIWKDEIKLSPSGTLLVLALDAFWMSCCFWSSGAEHRAAPGWIWSDPKWLNPSHQCFSVTEERSCLENQSLFPPWGSRERIILWNPGMERARNTRSLFAAQLGEFHPGIWDVKEVTHPKSSSPSCRASLAHAVLQAHSQAGKSGDKSQSGRRWEQQNIPDPLGIPGKFPFSGWKSLNSFAHSAPRMRFSSSIIPKKARNDSQPWDNEFPQQAGPSSAVIPCLLSLGSSFPSRTAIFFVQYFPRSDGSRE